MSKLSALETALGHAFQNRSLLEQALTHRSHGAAHNERLEFLGDSVLNFTVATELYKRFAKVDEGDLSRVRASLVKQSALAEIAQRLELSEHLRLGEGELKSGGFRRPSILADALEALLGAVFLDGGFAAVQKVVAALYEPVLRTVDPKTQGKDAKTLLQELLQGHKFDLPLYTVVATHGAAHSQTFEVECAIAAMEIKVSAVGSSRRAAEQLAATQAIEAVRQALPARKRASGRARKSAQLSLPVAVEQERK
jgi:ribonuclease-3